MLRARKHVKASMRLQVEEASGTASDRLIDGLHRGLRAIMRVCEDAKLLIVRPAEWEAAATETAEKPANKSTWKP